jgi:hypothetical protein
LRALNFFNGVFVSEAGRMACEQNSQGTNTTMTRRLFSLAATILVAGALAIPTLAQSGKMGTDKMSGDKMGGSMKMAGKTKCAACAKLSKKNGKMTQCAACKKKMGTKDKMGAHKMGGKM